MSYIDGYAAAVPTANREAFRAQAEKMATAFKEWGALQVMDAWGDEVPDGETTSFPMAVKCRPDETVVFGWIVWPSREARDAAHARMMADERLRPGAEPMPFDGKRLILGGFRPLVEM